MLKLGLLNIFLVLCFQLSLGQSWYLGGGLYDFSLVNRPANSNSTYYKYNLGFQVGFKTPNGLLHSVEYRLYKEDRTLKLQDSDVLQLNRNTSKQYSIRYYLGKNLLSKGKFEVLYYGFAGANWKPKDIIQEYLYKKKTDNDQLNTRSWIYQVSPFTMSIDFGCRLSFAHHILKPLMVVVNFDSYLTYTRINGDKEYHENIYYPDGTTKYSMINVIKQETIKTSLIFFTPSIGLIYNIRKSKLERKK